MAAKRAPRVQEPLKVTISRGEPMTEDQWLAFVAMLLRLYERRHAEDEEMGKPACER